ncbi:hypothetical protein [Nonomuraea sp. NPDC005650]|uniref:hypothetical protein n=1 Tax=Nonomuraea sp. NPDC005650 TaxID=3157045 RepID=UPI0033A6C145
MSRRIGDAVALVLVMGGLAALAVAGLVVAALLVKGLSHLLHGWWAAIPPMSFGTAAGVVVLLVLLVNVLTWLNFAGGSK